MSTGRSNRRISRRTLLNAAAKWGGLAATASFLEACARAGGMTPTQTTGLAQTLTPSATTAPSPTSQASPTASLGPTATSEPTYTPSLTPSPYPTNTPIPSSTPQPTMTPAPSPTIAAQADTVSVAFVRTNDRAAGVRQALQLLGINPVGGKQVFLKPNFNSDDPAPGSTHPDTLRTVIEELWALGARTITVGDRSGMGDTRRVMENLGVLELAEELGFETLVLNELNEKKDWAFIQPHESHWQKGFPFARAYLEAEALVQTCNLKTHQFGGHFTMSLKNSVGLVNKEMPGMSEGFMNELHSSRYQREMIAEINTAYTPVLIILDGVQAFTSGGPATGRLVAPEVVLAGTDRVAIDAVGVALLRYFGTTPQVAQGSVFQQAQIARAVELGLGVDGPDKIQLVTGDAASESYAAQIREVLLAPA